MAAWNLTQKGIKVLLLDAGDKFDRSKYWTHVQPWEARERTARGERPPQFFLDTKEQPYLTPDGRPFALTRVWGHGGKTNVWGRVSLRYSEMDLKAAERDGWEIPWPISLRGRRPYYDQVEQLIGVNGGTDDSEVLPGSKFLQPPPAPRCGERLLQKGMHKVGHTGGRGPARQHDARRSTDSRRVITAATAAPGVTRRRSSVRPITSCRLRCRPAGWRFARTRSSRAS